MENWPVKLCHCDYTFNDGKLHNNCLLLESIENYAEIKTRAGEGNLQKDSTVDTKLNPYVLPLHPIIKYQFTLPLCTQTRRIIQIEMCI